MRVWTFLLLLAHPLQALPPGELAARICTSTYRLVVDNRRPDYRLFRTLYGRAQPEPLGSSVDADNVAYLKLLDSPAARRLIFLHGMLKPLKQLNDHTFTGEESGGKEDVNAARNLFRLLLFENLQAHPELRKATVAQFLDFKTMELAIDPEKLPPEMSLTRELDYLVRQTQLQFEQVMLAYLGNNVAQRDAILQERGLAGDFRAWHLFGVAEGHPDFAVAAARAQARRFDRETGIQLKNAPFDAGATGARVGEVQGHRDALVAELGERSALFERYGGPTGPLVLSRTVADALRKVNTATWEEYVRVVTAEVELVSGVKLTPDQVRHLRDYFSGADDFQPTVRVATRGGIDLRGARQGVGSVDFAAQNVENLFHTMGALAQAQGSAPQGEAVVGQTVVALAREGEKLATERLARLKHQYDEARKGAGLGGEYQSSGDDGSLVLTAPPTEAQKRELYRLLRSYGDPISDYRIVWVPPQGKGSDVDVAGYSREILKGETLEKELRKALRGNLESGVLKKLGLPVTLRSVEGKLDLTLVGASPATAEVVRRVLATVPLPEGYTLGEVTALP